MLALFYAPLLIPTDVIIVTKASARIIPIIKISLPYNLLQQVHNYFKTQTRLVNIQNLYKNVANKDDLRNLLFVSSLNFAEKLFL